MLKSLSTKAMFAAGVATVAMSAVSAPAEAFAVFTDRTLWEGAISPTATQTNEAYNTDAIGIPLSITTDSGITVNTSDFGAIGSGQLEAPLGQVTFGLPGAHIAFGTDIRASSLTSPSYQTGWEALDAAGNVVGSGVFNLLGQTTFQFFGVVQDPGDALFSSFRITDQSGLSSFALFDNTSFATVSDSTPVPTPALLPGLIGMGVAALRKRKGEADEAEA